MPIVSVRELEARRRADERETSLLPPGGELDESSGPSDAERLRTDPPSDEPDIGDGGESCVDQRAQVSVRRRGHARKGANGKWLPTGSVGFAAPPVQHQFRAGNKRGGRKAKVAPSADDLLRKHLGQKRKVRLDGREQTIETRELLVITTLKAALEGDRAARKFVLAEFARLSPPAAQGEGPRTLVNLNAADALTLAEFRDELLAEYRESAGGDDQREGGPGAIS